MAHRESSTGLKCANKKKTVMSSNNNAGSTQEPVETAETDDQKLKQYADELNQLQTQIESSRTLAINHANLTVTVDASSQQVLSTVNLYVDGQEMNPSEDGSNFVINTCEWWNPAIHSYKDARTPLSSCPIANGQHFVRHRGPNRQS
jgi:hypothetical protein